MAEGDDRILEWIDATQTELRSKYKENEYVHRKRKRSRKEGSFTSDEYKYNKEDKLRTSFNESQTSLSPEACGEECCCAVENQTSECGIYSLDTEDGMNEGEEKTYQCTSPHEGRKLVDAELQMSVDRLFELVFTESSFYREFHKARNTSDIEQTPWEDDPESGQRKRKVVLTVSLGQAIGPKSSRVTENYVMLKCSSPGHLYSLDLSAQNSGFPYADAFYCFSHFCLQDTTGIQASHEKSEELESTGHNQTRSSAPTCHFYVYSQLIFTKSVWMMKPVIEKNSWLGLEEFYDSLISKLKLECENYSIEEGPRRRKHGIAGDKIAEAVQSKLGKDLIAKRQIRRKNKNRKSIRNMSSYMLAGIAIALLAIINIFLFYELTSIEALTRKSLTLPSKLDLTSLRNDPSTHEEWLKFTEKLIEFDDAETESWISDVQDTVNLLLKVEDVLKNLTDRIPLEVKHKALLRSMKKYHQKQTVNEANKE